MGMINEIVGYVNLIGTSIIIAGVLGCAVAFYFLKIKKVAAVEEHVDTSRFERRDAASFVPVRDILYKGDLDREGIIAVTDTLFVGGLSIRGFDYASASRQEKVDAQVNSQAFFNVLEDAVTFRQSVKGTDLSAVVEDYERALKDLAMRLMGMDADYRALLSSAQEAAADNPEDLSLYEGRLEEMQDAMNAVSHQMDECRALIAYVGALSKDSGRQTDGGGQRSSQILFSYRHDESQYSQELTKEQVCLKAQEALEAKARTYADALAQCHFRATRLSCRELLYLIRKHNCPISGEDGRLEDLLKSSHASLFVSSDSLIEAQKDLIGEREFEERVRRFEEEMKEGIERRKREMEGDAARLYEESLERALEELHGEGAYNA